MIGWQAVVVWLVVVAELAYVVASLILVPERPNVPLIARAIFGLEVASLGIIGALVATRQPRNVIGWILWSAAIAVTWSIAGDDYVTTSLSVAGGAWPGTIWVTWLFELSFLPAILAVLIFIPLLFPTGRLLSPRWRWVAWFAVAAIIASCLPVAFAPGPLPDHTTLLNPVGIAVVGQMKGAIVTASLIGFAIALPLAVASVVLRYRRGSATEREQLKWFAAAVGLTGVCFALAIPSIRPFSDIGWIAGIVTISLIPVAIGIAILRYRLYEIDRIISRTLGYVAVTATLALVFLAGVLGLQAMLEPMTGDNTAAVAASTLIVAALFQPLRARVQSFVDRRFNRARYDALHMVDAFSERLRDEVDIAAVTDDLDLSITTALNPSTLKLWIRGASV